jgi:hypothetical protein
MAFGNGNRRFTPMSQSGVLEANINSADQQDVCGDIDQVPFVLMSHAIGVRSRPDPRTGFCTTSCDDMNLPAGATAIT